MAGGLFDRPFAFNMKCIVFSIITMALFLYKPVFKNQYYLYFILFIIFVISYVAMAWYDYFFDCNLVSLKKGPTLGITQIFKPDTQDKKPTKMDIKMKNIVIYLSHLFFIVPLLIYISVYKKRINPMVYPLLGVLSIFTAGYHGVALMVGSHN